MKDDAIYIFHASRQWGNYIIGVVESNVVTALDIAKESNSTFQLDDLMRYTLVNSEVGRGIHFYIEVDNPDYEG